ncbi:hypothetical protein [Citrobacter freundii]|uniref:hypothetical protein n=1 Tax=Citrobacter freundii TaxID=546 RepID=UPI0019032CB6|nr:hypothetical protein [Citrobacter freundii]MBJ8931641.1 hypothetical protein [Citrobacter freundii]
MSMNQSTTSDQRKFQPGIFIEIDDLMGGRKISMVCDDGITAIDNINPEKAVPIMIHNKLTPTVIGYMHEILKSKSMERHYANVVTVMARRDMGALFKDSLLMIRVLTLIQSNKGKDELSDREYVEIINQGQVIQEELDDIISCLIEYSKQN